MKSRKRSQPLSGFIRSNPFRAFRRKLPVKRSTRATPAATIVPLLSAFLLTLGAGDIAPAEERLDRYVPADIGLYVELRDADDLLIPLTEPGAWLAIAEVAGQPARLEDTEEWSLRVQQTVGMSPNNAIRRLFAKRVAFVGEGLRQSQDAAILCRPAVDVRQLVRQWRAKPYLTASQTSKYRLPNSVDVAVHGKLLAFGDRSSPAIFPKTLELLETRQGTRLADDPAYQQLLERVPQDPDGVFFVRLGDPTTTAPARRPERPALLGPLRGSANVLLALHRQQDLLHFTAVGDATVTGAADKSGKLNDLVGTLPERTLLAWAGHVDHPAVADAINKLPPRNVLRIAFQVQQEAGTIDRLVNTFDPATCIAVGVVMPEARQVPAPPVPALAVLVKLRDPAQAGKEWFTLFHSTLAMYKMLSLKVSPPPRPLTLRKTNIGDVMVEQLDLSTALGPDPTKTPLGELHLSWAVDDDVLVLASHVDWLRQILAARRDGAPRLASTLSTGLKDDSSKTERDNIFIAQSGPIADLGQLWLRYFERFHPAVLEQRWWRRYQPGNNNARLGIQVVADNARRRLRVESVTPGLPAHGILEVGDEIVGCNGRRFATDDPLAEMRRGMQRRPDARYLEVFVERKRGPTRAYKVALPFVDPIQVLRRVVSIGRLVQRVYYAEDVPGPPGPRGDLTLEIRRDAEPLFAFPLAATSSPEDTATEQ